VNDLEFGTRRGWRSVHDLVPPSRTRGDPDAGCPSERGSRRPASVGHERASAAGDRDQGNRM